MNYERLYQGQPALPKWKVCPKGLSVKTMLCDHMRRQHGHEFFGTAEAQDYAPSITVWHIEVDGHRFALLRNGCKRFKLNSMFKVVKARECREGEKRRDPEFRVRQNYR